MTERRRQDAQPGCLSGHAAGRTMILVVVLLPPLCRATGQEKCVEPVAQALEYRRVRWDATVGAGGRQGIAQAPPSASLEAQVAAVIKSFDTRGAWVEKGHLKHHKVEPESGAIDSRTFIDNVKLLCAFLQVTNER